MVELTDEQKGLLKEIMADKFAAGPFSGMVFNAVVLEGQRLMNKDVTLDDGNMLTLIDGVLKTALQTRLRLKELSR